MEVTVADLNDHANDALDTHENHGRWTFLSDSSTSISVLDK